MDFQIATLTKKTLSWIMKQILCDDVTGVQLQACSFSKLQMTQIYLSLLHTKRFKCFRELKLKNISASSELFVNCEKLCRLSMYDQKKHSSCGQRGYAKMVYIVIMYSLCIPDSQIATANLKVIELLEKNIHFTIFSGRKLGTLKSSSEGSGNKSLVWQRYFLRTPNPRKKMQPHKV